MWNMPFSPAAFAKMTPRARMHASLQGLGNGSAAVETRGAHGEFQALVHNTLNAPTIGTALTGGAYHVAPSSQRFAPTFARPIGIQRTHSSESVATGSQVVRGAANLGSFAFNPASMNLLTVAPIPRGVLDVRVAPPLAPVAPLTQGTPVPTVPAPSGSGVQETTSVAVPPAADVAPPAAEEPPPADKGASLITKQVDPATASVSPPSSIPVWQLGLGAAVVFGGIWFLTRKG